MPEGILEAGRLPTLPVFPGTRRELVKHLARVLEPGSYVLDVNGTLGRTVLDLDVPFVIPTAVEIGGERGHRGQ